MNAQQQQKAIEALDRQKEKERKQRRAMFYHLDAFLKLHLEGVYLPYRILLDLEKAEYEGTFKEIQPNPYYPNPAITLKTKWSTPNYKGDESKLPLKTDEIMGEHITFPDLMADDECRKKWEEYEQRVKSEKLSIEKWGYYYARFLLPYDIENFSDFDFWGKVPEDAEEKKAIDGLRAACLEIWHDCKEYPQNYNMEPVLRKEEHKSVFDVGYGYI